MTGPRSKVESQKSFKFGHWGNKADFTPNPKLQTQFVAKRRTAKRYAERQRSITDAVSDSEPAQTVRSTQTLLICPNAFQFTIHN